MWPIREYWRGQLNGILFILNLGINGKVEEKSCRGRQVEG